MLPDPHSRIRVPTASNVSLTSTMYLQSVVVVVVLVCAAIPAQGYRDDSPMQKWSPEYFQYRFFPAQTTFKRRMPSYVQVLNAVL